MNMIVDNVLISTTAQQQQGREGGDEIIVQTNQHDEQIRRNKLLDLTRTFISELDNNYDYNKACEYLTNDFQFKTPLFHFKYKQEFRLKFPPLHKKNKPNFDDVIWDEDKYHTVIRKGKTKFGILTIHLYEVIRFNNDGTKIKSITTTITHK